MPLNISEKVYQMWQGPAMSLTFYVAFHDPHGNNQLVTPSLVCQAANKEADNQDSVLGKVVFLTVQAAGWGDRHHIYPGIMSSCKSSQMLLVTRWVRGSRNENM